MDTASNSRKRTRFIDLSAMRKSFSLKPLTLGVAGVLLSACSSDRQEAVVYTDLEDCTRANPDAVSQCEVAYKSALEEAARTAPKYRSASDCEYEFGPNQCQQVSSSNGSFFMPFMAGYMVSSLLSPRPYYQPMFTSYSRNSSYRYRWIGADGFDYGGYNKKRFNVSKRAFEKKPAVTRTISRGGFGSTVRAKSSWGSKSSSKGWGG
ncbi:DUF1190 family protein [Glaciecola siphonariae]|uniref:DUF1190 family protein n=1 Tax=Glaciecola siphonariae TaxID=521012 RepID=A0ABV9LRR3_9ALTE